MALLRGEKGELRVRQLSAAGRFVGIWLGDNRQRTSFSRETERLASCLCSFHTNVWGPAKMIYLNVGLKNWSFQNCLTVLSLLMPWTSILNWGLDDIFMVVLKKLERFQYHFSNVCFLQNDTKRCFLSICRGTAHSYLYEKIMVTKILFFFLLNVNFVK